MRENKPIPEDHNCQCDSKHKKKKRTIIVLISSVALHLIMLYMILNVDLIKQSEPPITLINLQDEQEDLSDLPASLKPKKSEFGTTVFFDQPSHEIPEQLPEAANLQEQTEQEQQASLMQEQQQQKEEQQAPKQQQAIIQQTPPDSSPVTHKEIAEKSQIAPTGRETHEKKEVVEEPQAKTVYDPNLQDRIKEISEQQQKIASYQQPSVQKPGSDTASMMAEQQAPKKKKSIIAMTKGFIENLKQEGDDWLERKGDDNKVPSLEELKYLSYEQKINWQLQASWKRNHGKTQIKQEGKAVIEFSIDVQGNITSVSLLKSSGNQQLDELILSNTKQAAPFPPLPKHFNKTSYKTGRIIHVSSSLFGF